MLRAATAFRMSARLTASRQMPCTSVARDWALNRLMSRQLSTDKNENKWSVGPCDKTSGDLAVKCINKKKSTLEEAYVADHACRPASVMYASTSLGATSAPTSIGGARRTISGTRRSSKRCARRRTLPSPSPIT